MDWVYPKRRGPEWKQSWTSQTIGSISAPPFQLIAIFAIVMALLWFSQNTGYKARAEQNSVNFQVVLILLPFLLMLFMALYSSARWPSFQIGRHSHDPVVLQAPARMGTAAATGNSSPWGVAVFVVVLLVLLSYQSSFHSKWLSFD